MSLLAVSLFSSLALAEHGLFRREDDNIPWDSNDDFEDWVESGNASTIRRIKIPNIHESAFPGDGDEADYEAFVRIEETGGDAGTTVNVGFRPDEKYVNDDGTLKAEDDHWLYCMDSTTVDAPDELGDDDVESDCSNVFDDDCLDWLAEFSKGGKFCYNKHEQWKDSPCAGLQDPNRKSDVFTSNPWFPIGPSNFSGSGNFSVAKEEKYDYSVKRIYMLAIGFARNNRTNEGGDYTIDIDALEDDSWEYAPSKVVCLRADEFSDESRSLEDIQDDEKEDDDDMGVAVNARLGWAMVAATVAMMLSASI